MRERLCRFCHGWHDVEAWPHNCLPAGPARSHLPFPGVISAAMEPVQSQLDGRMYDSKSVLRATYRAAGMIEVGNDPARLRTKKPDPIDRRSIRDSLEKAKARLNA